MKTLVAKDTWTMDDGRIFAEKGKEYEVVGETSEAYILKTEISTDHIFTKDPEHKAYYRRFFLLPEEVMKENVEEVEEKPSHKKNKK